MASRLILEENELFPCNTFFGRFTSSRRSRRIFYFRFRRDGARGSEPRPAFRHFRTLGSTFGLQNRSQRVKRPRKSGEKCFLAVVSRLLCVHAGNDKIFVKKFHIFCTFLTSILTPLDIGNSDHLFRCKWWLRTFLHTSRPCFAVFWRCARTAKKGDSWRRVKTPLLEHSRYTLVRP